MQFAYSECCNISGEEEQKTPPLEPLQLLAVKNLKKLLGERTQIVKSNLALREKALGKILLHDGFQ